MIEHVPSKHDDDPFEQLALHWDSVTHYINEDNVPHQMSMISGENDNTLLELGSCTEHMMIMIIKYV